MPTSPSQANAPTAGTRGRVVGLTPAGRKLVDALVPEHMANEDRLLAPLDRDERTQLAGLLSKLLVGLDGARD